MRGQPAPQTLKQTLAAAEAAFAGNDYAGAVRYFEMLQSTFGKEPEVATSAFQIVVITMHAYAALQADDTATAIRLFESFLLRFPEDRTRAPFVLFNLARAHKIDGNLDRAIEAYRSFVALDPDRPEAALATLAAAELMFEASRDNEGFDTLDALYARQPPGVIRDKARLTALQKALDLGRTSEARRYMLGEQWALEDLQELTVLAFNALKMGQALLGEKAYEDAIACYRLVPPYKTLLALQEDRLHQTRTRFEARKQSAGLYQGLQFWTQFYSQLLTRLEQQLETLRSTEDYTPGLYLAYGQAYLLADRPHEAWILFESLARDPALAESIRAEAHYRWILSAVEVGEFEDAFSIAQAFGERYPDSHLAPDALYLLASAYQEARKYREAVEVLDEFLIRYPSDDLAPRARFVRGYNYNLLNQPSLARQDFEAFIEQFPEHGLYMDARFWRALSFFAERDYETTLEALEGLKAKLKDHRLEPEVAYRLAATYYAKKDYATAFERIQSYLATYPEHSRHEEGRVLLGDIQMGRGDLSAARAIFASIQPSAGHLFAYAVFQTGKILRAVAGAEDREPEARASFLDSHLEHFQHYLGREDVPQRGRISEALYWVGWTHLEKDEPDLAREVFQKALEQYGDDLQAEEVLQIIDALARVEKRINGLGKADRESAMRAWVNSQKEEALEDNRLTYFSRLNFYLDSTFPSDEPAGFIFQNVEKVPIERLDPEGLGRIAAGLVDRYPRVAETYLQRLKDEHPDSRFRNYGYYAQAILWMQAGKYLEAGDELSRFLAESPMHPLATQVTLRYAECLTRTKRFDEARETLEGILTLRQARGRPHAEALLGLSRNAEAAGELERAIPYAQRVFNVYRAYPDLSAQAYWMSALQFLALGNNLVAYRTLEEMLEDPRIQQLPIAAEAKAKKDALLEQLPDGALDLAPEADPAQTAQLQTVNREPAP